MPGLIFVQKALGGRIFLESYLNSEGLIIGGHFEFQNGLGMTIKTA